MNNFLIIDGSALLSTHAFASMTEYGILAVDDLDKQNQLCRERLSMAHGYYTQDIGSFLLSIMKMQRVFSCDHVAVVFDKDSTKTYRKQVYPAYKGTRSPKPEVIKAEMNLLHTLLKRVGIPCFWSDLYEADDLAGTLVENFYQEFDNVYLVTKDHDWLQLVGNNVKVLLMMSTTEQAEEKRRFFASYVAENNENDKTTPTCYNKLVCYNADVVRIMESVDPIRIIDKKALAGDTSDNIPGVKNIGSKTAVILLAIHTSMEGVFDAIDNCEDEDDEKKLIKLWKDYGIKRSPLNSLKQYEMDAHLSKRLATINTAVPGVNFGIEKLTYNLNKTKLEDIDKYLELHLFDSVEADDTHFTGSFYNR